MRDSARASPTEIRGQKERRAKTECQNLEVTTSPAVE